MTIPEEAAARDHSCSYTIGWRPAALDSFGDRGRRCFELMVYSQAISPKDLSGATARACASCRGARLKISTPRRAQHRHEHRRRVEDARLRLDLLEHIVTLTAGDLGAQADHRHGQINHYTMPRG